jgi:hypothetical protein
MHHLIYVLLLVGVIILIFATIMALRSHLQNRRGNAAPFRDYFGPQYDRDLLRYSALSEAEDWQADPHSRFAPIRLRDPDTTNRFTNVSGTAQRNRERN